jgi:hypothetical protein
MTSTQTAATNPRRWVLVDGDRREVHRYTQMGSANRRASTIRGARVLTADAWDAEQAAAAADAVSQIEAAEAMDAEAEAEIAAPDGLGAPSQEEDDAEYMAAMEAEREAASAASFERYAARRAARNAPAQEEPAEEKPAAHPFENYRPSPEGINPLRDWLQPTEEEKREQEAPAPAKTKVTTEERRAEYAARTEQGPRVEREIDGTWYEVRRYECDRRAARAARGMATRTKRAQAHARVITADGTVLLDTATDELCIQARAAGEALSGLRPV